MRGRCGEIWDGAGRCREIREDAGWDSSHEMRRGLKHRTSLGKNRGMRGGLKLRMKRGTNRGRIADKSRTNHGPSKPPVKTTNGEKNVKSTLKKIELMPYADILAGSPMNCSYHTT